MSDISYYKGDSAYNMPSGKRGFIYIARPSHESFLYKIGCSSNPESRVKSLSASAASPSNFLLLCKLNCDCMYSVERDVHAELAAFHYRKEFFSFPNDKSAVWFFVNAASGELQHGK